MVTLFCPNCGRSIGHACHEDNYIEKFDFINQNGEPFCRTCGEFSTYYPLRIVAVIISIVIAVTGLIYILI